MNIVPATKRYVGDDRIRLRLFEADAQETRRVLQAIVLPESPVRDRLGTGELVHICPEWRGGQHNMSLVFSTRRHMAPRIRTFIEALASEFCGLTL